MIEQELQELGLNLIYGIDEVGRGCGAGPMTMAAACLPLNHHIEPKYLRDSKKMTPKMREEANKLIRERAFDLVVVDIPEGFIDQYGISETTREGVRLLIKGLKLKPDMICIDGRDLFYTTFGLPYTCLIHGEDRSFSIAAASIVAKVHRDNWMKGFYHEQWPQYGFDRNKGYLSAFHRAALEKYGPCPCHRKTYMLKGKEIGKYGR